MVRLGALLRRVLDFPEVLPAIRAWPLASPRLKAKLLGKTLALSFEGFLFLHIVVPCGKYGPQSNTLVLLESG